MPSRLDAERSSEILIVHPPTTKTRRRRTSIPTLAHEWRSYASPAVGRADRLQRYAPFKGREGHPSLSPISLHHGRRPLTLSTMLDGAARDDAPPADGRPPRARRQTGAR